MLILASAAAALYYFYAGGGYQKLETLILSLQGFGGQGAVLFILIFWLASSLFLPLGFLMFASGVVYGFIPGFFIAHFAAMLSAATSFIAGRYLMKDWVQKKAAQYPAVKAMDGAVNCKGWKVVMLSRLAPIFPFTLLNSSFGTTHIPFLEYLGATLLAMAPGTALWVFSGSVAGSFTRMSPIEGISGWQRAAALIGLCAALFAAILSMRMGQKILKKAYGVEGNAGPLKTER